MFYHSIYHTNRILYVPICQLIILLFKQDFKPALKVCLGNLIFNIDSCMNLFQFIWILSCTWTAILHVISFFHFHPICYSPAYYTAFLPVISFSWRQTFHIFGFKDMFIICIQKPSKTHLYPLLRESATERYCEN